MLENANVTELDINTTLTTDDLIFLIGEKTVELLQKDKVIRSMKSTPGSNIKNLLLDTQNKINELETELKELKLKNLNLETVIIEKENELDQIKKENTSVNKNLTNKIHNLRKQIEKTDNT